MLTIITVMKPNNIPFSIQSLFTDKKFKDLSCDELLYGLLLDRMSLSIKINGLIKQSSIFTFIGR